GAITVRVSPSRRGTRIHAAEWSFDVWLDIGSHRGDNASTPSEETLGTKSDEALVRPTLRAAGLIPALTASITRENPRESGRGSMRAGRWSATGLARSAVLRH